MRTGTWLLVFLAWLPAATVHGADVASLPDQLEQGMVNPGYHDKPDWFKNSFLDIRDDIAEASAQDKRVLLYFYQDGCPYCQKLLEVNLGLAEIRKSLRNKFDVIAINMWGDREVTDLSGEARTEKQFSESLRVMFTPTLLFLDEHGRVVLRLNGYYPPHRFQAALDYVSGRMETRQSFRDYLASVAPQPASGKLHTDAAFLKLDQLRRSMDSKPLLVLFEQKDCVPCDELHLDILQRPESRALMDKLDIALVDMWSRESVVRPDGSTSSVRDWAKALNVQYAPSLVFFGADGKEIFRADAWLRAFHIQSVMDYVASGAWRTQPNFQRFIAARADRLEAQGVHVDLLD